jgi:hypothetical protein
VLLLVLGCPPFLAASTITVKPAMPPPLASAAAAADAAAAGSSSSGGQNPVFALAGFLKDQLVRMKDGTVECYTNHKRCNDIRSKQRTFAQSNGEPRRTATSGGITYEEYDFLQRGKDDRGKVGSLVFMSFFAPNFLPYMIMFNPGAMPSPFRVPPAAAGSAIEETKWEKISRQRTHAVLSALLDMEKSARVAPTLSKMNPFGAGKTKRTMERIDAMGHTGATLLTTADVVGSSGGAALLRMLSNKLYKSSADGPWDKKDTQLLTVPKPIIRGLAGAISAETGPPSSFLPNFMVRGQVINHIQKVAEADEFLVKNNIDLGTIAGEPLMQACDVRLIGGPGRSDDELRQGLKQWLNDVTATEDGKQCNANLARAALLGYNAVEGARDARSMSYLPRLMFQGQYGSQVVPRYEDAKSQKKRRK